MNGFHHRIVEPHINNIYGLPLYSTSPLKSRFQSDTAEMHHDIFAHNLNVHLELEQILSDVLCEVSWQSELNSSWHGFEKPFCGQPLY